ASQAFSSPAAAPYPSTRHRPRPRSRTSAWPRESRSPRDAATPARSPTTLLRLGCPRWPCLQSMPALLPMRGPRNLTEISSSLTRVPGSLSRREFGAQERHNIVDSHSSGLGVASPLVFHLAILEPALAHRDPMRNADQLEIGKHYARTLSAIVEQHVGTGGLKLGMQALCQRAYGIAAIQA